MIEIITTTVSLSLLISLVFNYNIYRLNTRLSLENDKLKKKNDDVKKYTDGILSIKIGDRAIIPDYGLTYKEEELSFKVNYEVEIIDIAEKKVKVIALDYEAQCSTGRDPSNKKGIIEFMQSKWIDKSKLEVIVDDRMRRDRKLRDLGID